MKIKNLEINKLRGIKNLTLNLGFENAVIWGPNGSGKSAVADAIDFLLTGKIPRLTGEGTQGVTISKHGPHIDDVESPGNARVSAEINIPGIKNTVRLSRTIGEPDKLEIEGAAKEELDEILNLAARRQHSLSRREILKYISAKAGVRSSEVQAVLDLKELEETRKAFVNVANQTKVDLKHADSDLKKEESAILVIIGMDQFSDKLLVDAVNDLRTKLGAKKLAKAEMKDIKKNVKRPEKRDDKIAPNPALIERALGAITDIPEETIKQRASIEKELRENINKVQADPEVLEAYERMQLLKMGIGMLDGSGQCPLCGYKWLPDELEDRLNKRMQKAKHIAPIIKQINLNGKEVKDSIIKIHATLAEFSRYALQLNLKRTKENIDKWSDKLQTYINACEEPLHDYMASGLSSDLYKTLFRNAGFFRECKQVLKKAKELVPQVTPELIAWDTLTRLEPTIPRYYSAKKVYDQAKQINKRAQTLYSLFEKVRQEQLGALYDSIKDRFSEFYRRLHSDDEDEFDAVLKADGKFAVDFYGRGKHPPLALHSEGHQDSMGLCLYLALAERLTKDKCQLTVLDDVVMSVDASHRRQVCQLLKTYFPDRQFLITTHDKTWARQLQMEGVVKKAGCFEFNRWNIDTGPCVEIESEMWANIDRDLAKSDVPNAAFRLRNGGERFFEGVCDALGGQVRYKSDGRWELGDFMHAVI
jgi:recombinational DNA repair ATPase RecF